MSVLSLLPTDIKKKLNPQNSPIGFLGEESKVDLDDVVESILEFEDTVMSRLPSRYQPLLTHIDGEILERSAIAGQTTVKLGLKPVSEVRIWVNLDRPWDSRRSSDALTDGKGCNVNATTGLITLDSALRDDDTVVGEYDHDALSTCRLLRRITADLCAAEWARRLYPDDSRWDRYAEWEKSAWYDLARMKGTKDGERMGILMFDRLKLIDETVTDRSVGGGELDSSGDMM